ncbi:Uncharacterized protein dnm_024530 [Desulfonema magnum]|uniref:Uncharacterized protein n=1 Tax=Desulfonema magnum TaxID=45655 RepID=A0A975GM89_9BACT|nr:Uncharacterized protein dnm_024530 [Desulfonema magnum]
MERSGTHHTFPGILFLGKSLSVTMPYTVEDYQRDSVLVKRHKLRLKKVLAL